MWTTWPSSTLFVEEYPPIVYKRSFWSSFHTMSWKKNILIPLPCCQVAVWGPGGPPCSDWSHANLQPVAAFLREQALAGAWTPRFLDGLWQWDHLVFQIHAWMSCLAHKNQLQKMLHVYEFQNREKSWVFVSRTQKVHETTQKERNDPEGTMKIVRNRE